MGKPEAEGRELPLKSHTTNALACLADSHPAGASQSGKAATDLAGAAVRRQFQGASNPVVPPAPHGSARLGGDAFPAPVTPPVAATLLGCPRSAPTGRRVHRRPLSHPFLQGDRTVCCPQPGT